MATRRITECRLPHRTTVRAHDTGHMTHPRSDTAYGLNARAVADGLLTTSRTFSTEPKLRPAAIDIDTTIRHDLVKRNNDPALDLDAVPVARRNLI